MTVSTRRAALGAILTAPLATVPGVASEPSDLARACGWAVKHRRWIDDMTTRSPMSDAELDAECQRVDAVISRAIAEESTGLHDLGAKAALALEDYERFMAMPGTPLDDGERIVLTVLREVVKLCA